MSKEVASRIRSKVNIRVLTKDYSLEELKGIIGQMDLFIGTRMHSNILALSMRVPTIAISCQRKTEGIMSMLRLTEYVLDIATITFDDMVSMIERVWNNQQAIAGFLKQRAEKAEELALCNAKLVKDVICRD